jgi:hypothetical protein
VKIDVRTNYPEVARWYGDVQKQARFATSRALNATANVVRDNLRAEARRVFDRPTPYIVNSFKVRRYSSRDNLEAEIGATYMGGKGVDPERLLEAEIAGGPRRLKSSERALQRAGILPGGHFTVPGEAAPLDQYGNIKGSFLVQLLSYFQAFSEQGYKANMTGKRKAQLAKRGTNARGFRTINGVEYFVAYGRLRGGKTKHLHPGIWSRSGTHGSNVKPVLMFVRRPNYKPRLNIERVAERAVSSTFGPAFGRSFEDALRTARPPEPVR